MKSMAIDVPINIDYISFIPAKTIRPTDLYYWKVGIVLFACNKIEEYSYNNSKYSKQETSTNNPMNGVVLIKRSAYFAKCVLFGFVPQYFFHSMHFDSVRNRFVWRYSNFLLIWFRIKIVCERL